MVEMEMKSLGKIWIQHLHRALLSTACGRTLVPPFLYILFIYVSMCFCYKS